MRVSLDRMIVLAVLPGFVIGALLGLLGGGGSILTVPIFVYVLGFAPKDAVAMSLAVVGVTSIVGAIGHLRRDNVSLRTAFLFGAAAMTGTFIGTRIAPFVSGSLQLTVFGVVMLAAALFMFRGRAQTLPVAEQRFAGVALALVIPQAFGIGVLTGLVGVGGGFLIVPALVMLKVPVRLAIGTSLVVIALNCVVGFYGYLGRAEFAWGAMALVTVGTLPGIWTGTHLCHIVSQNKLRRGFAVFLLFVSAFILQDTLSKSLNIPSSIREIRTRTTGYFR